MIVRKAGALDERFQLDFLELAELAQRHSRRSAHHARHLQPPCVGFNADDTEMCEDEYVRSRRDAIGQLVRRHAVAIGCVRRHLHGWPPIIY
jgi:hypothetical protein